MIIGEGSGILQLKFQLFGAFEQVGRFLGEIQISEGSTAGVDGLVLGILLKVGVDLVMVFHEGLRSAYCAQVVWHLVVISILELIIAEKLIIFDHLHLSNIITTSIFIT